MKHLTSIVAFFLMTSSALADLSSQAEEFQNLYNYPSSSTQISKSEMNVGETRPKSVLKGVFYFGGSDVKRNLLSSKYQNKLCNEGFSQAYSVYSKVNSNVSCNNTGMNYTYIGQAGGDNVYKLMSNIYNIIKSNGNIGPIYLHCYYGVHASNTYAQMALKQFCDISDAEALANWDKVNIYNSLDAKNKAIQQQKIRSFQPYPEFQITDAEKAVVCY